MAGRTKKSDLGGWIGREARAVARLSPWIGAALLIMAVLWGPETAALSGLFQSPPTDTPTVPATDTPAATATLPPTVPPPETPTLPPTEAPTATMEPTFTPEPTATVEVTPTLEATATLTPTVEVGEGVGGEGEEPQRYAEGESNLRFEWGMLFDSVALGLSYLWLCCGVLVVMAVPLFFIILWIASKRRKPPQA